VRAGEERNLSSFAMLPFRDSALSKTVIDDSDSIERYCPAGARGE